MKNEVPPFHGWAAFIMVLGAITGGVVGYFTGGIDSISLGAVVGVFAVLIATCVMLYISGRNRNG